MGNFFQNFNNGFQFGMAQHVPLFPMPAFCMPVNFFMPSLFSTFNYSPCSVFNTPIYNVINSNVNFYRSYQSPLFLFDNYNPANLSFYNFALPNYSFYQNCSYNSSMPVAKETSKIRHTANELYQKWSNKKISKDAQLSLQFCEKVIKISQNIKCNPDDLMAVMYHESKFSPKAKNESNQSKNVGLIQFGARSRESLNIAGSNPEETFNTMIHMSAMEQLDCVEKFYKGAKKQAGYDENDVISAGTLAALAFRPKYAKQEVLAQKGCDAYEKNKELDKNKDGKITKTELANRLINFKA